MEGLLTTASVAAASGYSVQQVRDLEARGVIAPAARGANGYRRFSPEHVRDLRAYRSLADAVGPVRARHALREIRTLPRDRAVAVLGGLVVALSRERDEALAALHALRTIRDETSTDAPPSTQDQMTITELAGALGVRASALRFWETVGLVRPDRIPTRAGTARRYPVHAVREARITAALRAAGYRIPELQRAMVGIRSLDGPDDPLTALQARIDDVARRTLVLLRVGADVADIVEGATRSSPPAG